VKSLDIGIAENYGDALTYYILTPQKRFWYVRWYGLPWILSNPISVKNLFSMLKLTKGSLELDLASELSSSKLMPEFDPLDAIDLAFDKVNDADIPEVVQVQAFDETNNCFAVLGVDDEEEWCDANVVQEALLSKQDDGATTWVIKQFLGHRRSNKNNKWEVNIEWASGDDIMGTC
jgi:hypothetical protein